MSFLMNKNFKIYHIHDKVVGFSSLSVSLIFVMIIGLCTGNYRI